MKPRIFKTPGRGWCLQFYTQGGTDMTIEGFPDRESAQAALSLPELKHLQADHRVSFGQPVGWYCEDCQEAPR